MKRKYLLSHGPQTARLARIFAKGIDLALVTILAMLSYSWGLALGILYLALSDSLYDGQSFGKRFVGFAVVSLEDGFPCSTRQSFIRNLPFLVPLGLALIPVWGWIIAPILGVPLIFLELYLLFKLDSAHRLGDVMADTTVIANDQTRANIRKSKQSWFEKERPLPFS